MLVHTACSCSAGMAKSWKKASDWITPMREKVRPMLEEAAAKYVADKKDWVTQKCS